MQANTTRLDDAGDKKPEARSRTEDCLRAGKEAEVREKSIANCRQEPHPEDWLRQAYVTRTQEDRTRTKTTPR